MPYTRTQANSLLSKAEMTLFDESRANAVRRFDDKALAGRIDRTRKLRDKARDQLQRQRLASRSRTGSKRGTSGEANRRSKDKAELMADILKRFEVQARAAGKQAHAGAAARRSATTTGGKKAAASKAVGKKTTAKKAATKKAATKKAATKKATGGTAAARKTAPSKAATKTSTAKAVRKEAKRTTGRAARKATQAAAGAGRAAKSADRATDAARPARKARKAGKAGKREISPDQALANTRALLDAKKRHDRAGPAWQHMDGAASPAAGRYQSPEARSRAEELHAGESRMTAIEGSISTRGRKNQAKRDKR
jgi:hypothetical protein